jgi:ATP synthase protein I
MNGSPGGGPAGAPPGKPREEEGFSVSEFAGVGLQFAVSILVFLYLGQWLDRKLGTAPWLLIIGVFLGAGASFYSMYRKLMAAQARDEAARKARKAPPGSAQ